MLHALISMWLQGYSDGLRFTAVSHSEKMHATNALFFVGL